VLQHLFIAEPKHTERNVPLQPSGPPGIIFIALYVRIAVDLDCQPRLQTDEVDNVRADGMLLAKVCAANLPTSQPLP
jgi:hypothetical protein